MHTPRTWQVAAGREIVLDRPRLMGILNLTPDSFSDGGAYASVNAAVAAAERMIAEGADVIDVGGESTRPGAPRVGAPEQMRRVVPVIRGIRAELDDRVAISIDTTLGEVAAAALDAGADAINDVSAGTEDGDMLPLAAESGAGLVLMHRLAAPGADVYSHEHEAGAVRYPRGVVAEVREFLRERAARAEEAGVASEAIVVDPGLGFGKSVEENLALIRDTREFASLGFPVLSGVSRKSFTAVAAGLPKETPPRERLAPTLALSAAHLLAGASLFRVHDVREHAQALRAAYAVGR